MPILLKLLCPITLGLSARQALAQYFKANVHDYSCCVGIAVIVAVLVLVRVQLLLILVAVALARLWRWSSSLQWSRARSASSSPALLSGLV